MSFFIVFLDTWNSLAKLSIVSNRLTHIFSRIAKRRSTTSMFSPPSVAWYLHCTYQTARMTGHLKNLFKSFENKKAADKETVIQSLYRRPLMYVWLNQPMILDIWPDFGFTLTLFQPDLAVVIPFIFLMLISLFALSEHIRLSNDDALFVFLKRFLKSNIRSLFLSFPRCLENPQAICRSSGNADELPSTHFEKSLSFFDPFFPDINARETIYI